MLLDSEFGLKSTLNVDVAIVGAGMIGLSMAVACAQLGLKTVLLERGQCQSIDVAAQNPYQQTTQVSAITPASQTLLQELGVWSQIAQTRLSPYTRMLVWDQATQAQIEFLASQVGQESLGFIIENRVICQALLSRAQDFQDCLSIVPEVDLHALRIDEQTQDVQLQLKSGKVLTAALLIGADGKDSWVRQQLAWQHHYHDYQQHGLVCTVQTEKPHQHTAWQVFLPTGPLAFLPLQDPYHSSIVWSIDQAQIESFLSLSDAAFHQALTKAFEGRLGRVLHNTKRLSFALTAESAKGYVRPQVALIGDAAHRIHPLAGQGANLGFYDVKALSACLSLAKRKNRALGSLDTLRAYERKRMGHSQLMSHSMTGLKTLFAAKPQAVVRARQLGLTAVNHFTPLKRLLIKAAVGERLI